MMKKLFFLFLLFSSAVALHAQTNENAPKDITKVFEFKNDQYDFGKIIFGKPVEYDVIIKNISHDSASIDNVQVGCGCTTPKYERGKKFGPGETIKITLGFNGNTFGVFQKSATLFFNNGTLSKPVNFKGETFTAPANNPSPANESVEKIKASNN
jgi:hypothetical protein